MSLNFILKGQSGKAAFKYKWETSILSLNLNRIITWDIETWLISSVLTYSWEFWIDCAANWVCFKDIKLFGSLTIDFSSQNDSTSLVLQQEADWYFSFSTILEHSYKLTRACYSFFLFINLYHYSKDMTSLLL